VRPGRLFKMAGTSTGGIELRSLLNSYQRNIRFSYSTKHALKPTHCALHAGAAIQADLQPKLYNLPPFF
jgi:hypothetical protein